MHKNRRNNLPKEAFKVFHGIYPTNPLTGVTSFALGARPDTKFWKGSMDEFQLYNKELSQAEILWLANETSPMDKPF